MKRDSDAIGEASRTVELIQRQLGDGMTFEQACQLLKLTEQEIRETRSSFEKKS